MHRGTAAAGGQAAPTTRRRHVRHIRREDVLAAFLVAVVIASITFLGSAFLIARWYEPQGSPLGRPARIVACDWRSYRADPDQPTTLTWSEIRVGTPPGHEPAVFEPVLGQIPLTSLLSGKSDVDGLRVCDTVIFLHVGPDAYVAYSLEGGP